jgi:dUTP diphosphatase
MKGKASPMSNTEFAAQDLQDNDYLTEAAEPEWGRLKYEASDPEFELKQGYPGDAGFDLAASEDWTVDAHEHGLIPTGVKLEIPDGLFVWIVARSSTMKNWGFMVLPGIIDTGFRGELFASVYNTRGYSVSVKKGDRIAQVVPLPNIAPLLSPQRVDFVDADTSRGAAGFGSTGIGGSGCLAGCP